MCLTLVCVQCLGSLQPSSRFLGYVRSLGISSNVFCAAWPSSWQSPTAARWRLWVVAIEPPCRMSKRLFCRWRHQTNVFPKPIPAERSLGLGAGERFIEPICLNGRRTNGGLSGSTGSATVARSVGMMNFQGTDRAEEFARSLVETIGAERCQ